MGYLVILLGILLSLSAAGNAWQYHEHTKDAVKFGATDQLARDTKGSAEACAKGVGDLQKAAGKRQDALLAAMKEAQPKVAALEAAATVAARAKPDDPKDLCGSLERYYRLRIKEERGASVK